MNLASFIFRSLVHHRRRHVGTVFGAAVATTVLTAALIVGDSVRSSLGDLVLRRLGRTAYVVETGERRFRAALAGEVASDTGLDTAAALTLSGAASAPDTGLRAPHVRIVGVDASFGRLAPDGAGPGALGPGEAAVNEALAAKLGIEAGAFLVVRMAKPGALPADVPLGSEDKPWVSLRVAVRRIVGDSALGRFSLQATQLTPPTVFLPRDELAGRIGAGPTANLLLVAAPKAIPAGDDPLKAVAYSIGRRRTLADHGLELRAVTNGGGWELRSGRVFMDDREAAAALAAATGAREIFTYFVNELRSGVRACPYSMVSAPTPGAPMPAGDAIDVAPWLAEDLGVAPGAPLKLTCFVLDAGRRLVETSREFRVRAVLPDGGASVDPSLMPDFPGLSDTERCGDWKPGIPVDLDRIRPKDEAYWKAHRGAPKAFIGLDAARAMWGNAFGSRTAIRWPAGTDRSALETAILARLPPAAGGLVVRPVRDDGLRAGAGGTDFGQLFMGLGFFIVAAALILAGLMLGLAVETRAAEAGLLLAVGYAPRRVRALLLGEAALLAAAGAVIGAAGGIGATAAVIAALRTVWQGAVGTSALALHVVPATVAGGAAAGFAASVAAAAAVLWRQTLRTVRELQSGADPGRRRRKRPSVRFALAAVCGAGALAAAVYSRGVSGGDRAGLFFAAGGLALACGLFATAGALARRSRRTEGADDGMIFGPRNWARRSRRSMAAVLMPACGLFLVLAVGIQRPDAGHDPRVRASGTGGYTLYGETSLPMPRDPSTDAGRRLYGLAEADTAGAEFAMLRLREGDDASCLNLNRVALPPLLGVPVDAFARRGSFAFGRMDPRAGPGPGAWQALDADCGPGVIPAVADASVIEWGLGRKVGDRIALTDEAGRPVEILLIGALSDSIFQGRLLISDASMQRHFPSAAPRVMLVETAAADGGRTARALEDRLGDLGLDLQPAAARLAAFTVVERTYLDIFLALGAIGLLIGSAGFGAVAHRNIVERRAEYALLQALGWRRRRILRGVALEHVALAGLGLAIGAGAAALAVLPGGGAVPASWPLALLPVAIALMAAVSVTLSARAALSAPPLQSLREE